MINFDDVTKENIKEHCIFLSCHVSVSEWIQVSIDDLISRNSLLKTGAIFKV